MDKTKQGIALFITLMVIASIMSIIAVSFTYLEKVQKDAGTTSALIQGDLLYNNTKQILKRFFPKGSDNSQKLRLIYMMPLMLNEPKSGFSINLACKPLNIGVPISWLNEKETKSFPQKSTLAQTILGSIMQEYDIREPSKLEEYIFQALKGEQLNDENNYIPRVVSKKGFMSQKNFNKLMVDYRLEFDDENVLNVPWEEYFAFIPTTNRTRIDGAYLSHKFISLAFEIPLEIVKDSWIEGESTLQTFLQENGIIATVNQKIYANKALNAMHCELSYEYKTQLYSLNFDYIEGRSVNFEFNGQKQ